MPGNAANSSGTRCFAERKSWMNSCALPLAGVKFSLRELEKCNLGYPHIYVFMYVYMYIYIYISCVYTYIYIIILYYISYMFIIGTYHFIYPWNSTICELKPWPINHKDMSARGPTCGACARHVLWCWEESDLCHPRPRGPKLGLAEDHDFVPKTYKKQSFLPWKHIEMPGFD